MGMSQAERVATIQPFPLNEFKEACNWEGVCVCVCGWMGEHNVLCMSCVCVCADVPMDSSAVRVEEDLCQ